MAALARLRGLERRFSNGLHAVGPLDLDIEDGEFLSLVGPSGCGKSTALRVIAGLIAPSSGTLTWTHEPPRKGFVFQDPTLMPWATAREREGRLARGRRAGRLRGRRGRRFSWVLLKMERPPILANAGGRSRTAVAAVRRDAAAAGSAAPARRASAYCSTSAAAGAVNPFTTS